MYRHGPSAARSAPWRLLLTLALLVGTVGAWPGRPAAQAAPVLTATLVATPASAPANGVAPINLAAGVHDPSGQAVPGITVRLATDHPESVLTQPLSPTDILGRATGSITSTVAGPATIALLDAGSDSILARVQVTFQPAPDPATSTVRAGPASLSASGLTSTVPVTVTVRDYSGQPMPFRTIRLTTTNPGDIIVQPVLTDGLGQTTGTVGFTGATTIVTATDMDSGITLGSMSLHAPATATTSITTGGIHVLLQPSATRMGNGASRSSDQDSDHVDVRLTLLDGRNRPLAGKRVALSSTVPFVDTGAPGVTNSAGIAVLRVHIRRLARHFGTASGPVVVGAVDLTDAQPLTATTRIAVYNRVVVLVQGLGTSLSCTLAECHDSPFSQISADALAPLGYNLNGDGRHRTELEYSYRGGAMVQMANGTWQWLIAPYRACDTMQPLERSAQVLRDLLESYHQRYPYTTFELIGHSLGGLVALDALAGDGGAFLRGLGPAAVDKLVTIDAPVNGINKRDTLLLLGDLLGGLSTLHSCSGQSFGAYLITSLFRINARAPGLQRQWVHTLRGAGVELLSATNSNDQVVPERYAILDDGQTRHVSDRARYALGDTEYQNGHGALLYRHRRAGTPNPAWTDFVDTLRAYLTTPCMPFSVVTAACPYPTIDRGF